MSATIRLTLTKSWNSTEFCVPRKSNFAKTFWTGCKYLLVHAANGCPFCVSELNFFPFRESVIHIQLCNESYMSLCSQYFSSSHHLFHFLYSRSSLFRTGNITWTKEASLCLKLTWIRHLSELLISTVHLFCCGNTVMLERRCPETQKSIFCLLTYLHLTYLHCKAFGCF